MKNEYFFMGNGKKSILGMSDDHQNVYDDTNYNYDYNDNNDSHVILTKLVDEGSKVLDVGCATGILGKFLFDNKTHNIDGIEMDRKAIEVAKKKQVYNKIHCFSIEDDENKECVDFFGSPEKYDYIVLADVLEHIVNPSKVLLKLYTKLKPTGKFLISIPNIANIDIIKGLFNNEFNYRNTGLLDVTHFRFYTCNSFVDFINNINKDNNLCLKTKYIGNTKVKIDYMEYKAIKEFLEDKYSDLEIIQNVFEISISKDKVINKYKNDKSTMDFIENKIIERNKTIMDQREEIEQLKSQLAELNKKYIEIVENKWFKMISKFMK